MVSKLICEVIQKINFQNSKIFSLKNRNGSWIWLGTAVSRVSLDNLMCGIFDTCGWARESDERHVAGSG